MALDLYSNVISTNGQTVTIPTGVKELTESRFGEHLSKSFSITHLSCL
jgi:hypothetical protein